MSELSIHELEAETGEVLPERETLAAYTGSFNHIFAFNTSLALQEHTHHSFNSASANQHISLSTGGTPS